MDSGPILLPELVDLMYRILDPVGRVCLSLTCRSFLQRYPIPTYLKGLSFYNEAARQDYLELVAGRPFNPSFAIQGKAYRVIEYLSDRLNRTDLIFNVCAASRNHPELIPWLIDRVNWMLPNIYPLLIAIRLTGQIDHLEKLLSRLSTNIYLQLEVPVESGTKWLELTERMGFTIEPSAAEFAATTGNISALKWFLDRYAYDDNHRDSLMIGAMSSGRREMVEFLLSHDFPLVQQLTLEIPFRGNRKYFHYLQSLGIDLMNFYTPIALGVIESGDLEVLRLIGPIPWHYAVKTSHYHLLDWLLTEFARPDFEHLDNNISTQTALWAIAHGFTPKIDRLIRNSIFIGNYALLRKFNSLGCTIPAPFDRYLNADQVNINYLTRVELNAFSGQTQGEDLSRSEL